MNVNNDTLINTIGALAFIAVYDEDEIMDPDHIEFSLRAKIKNMKIIAEKTLVKLKNSIDMDELGRYNSKVAQENLDKLHKLKEK